MKIPLILLLIFPSFLLSAQKLSQNPLALELAKKSIEKMYNLETEESVAIANKLEKICPGHPAPTFLKALNVYWSSMPVHSQSKNYNKFVDHLNETLQRAEKLLEKDKENEEGIFFSLAAHGYLTQIYAEEKNHLKAFKEVKNAYSYMKTGFDLLHKSPEFYYTTGLYNYYREQYPESHPGYKAFVWVLAGGDKEKGLQQLHKASNEALFTKTEAINYSAIIHLRYEANAKNAEQYASKIVRLFPGNYLYRAVYSETLLNLGKYWEAIPHINQLVSSKDPFFKMIGSVYHGIRVEKHEKKLSEAKEIFYKMIEDSQEIPVKTDHYVSMAYLGLGRIYLKEGDKDKAKEYFKKTLNLSNYPSIKNEAEQALKMM